jgi:hypothetical protein
VCLAVGPAVFVALHRGSAGTTVAATALAASASAILTGRLVDTVTARPGVAGSAWRGWPGLVLGIAVAAAVGAAIGASSADLGTGDAVAVGAVVGAVALLVEIGVEVSRAALPAERSAAQARAALRPVAVLAPFAMAGPTAYVAGRLLLG